jgi:outer membrane protein, adhesin transport system
VVDAGMRFGLVAAGLILLGGCLGRQGTDGGDDVTRAAPPPTLNATMQDGSTSPLIEELLNRVSVLQPGPLQDVANAVLEANTFPAEADLRAARLRAQAQSTNWLPSIGPEISLNALGAVVATIMISQVIFDNGAAKAEREFAKADVEVAAVQLAEDSNDRVQEALDLYITIQAALARAAINDTGTETMEHLAYVMTERVNAGISDRADLQLVLQKQGQVQSDMQSDLELAASSLAALQAMSARPLDTLSGLSPIGTPSPMPDALTVIRAEAESNRTIASVTAQTAGFLPGINVGGNILDGADGLELNVAVPNGLNLGTGAQVEAVQQETAAAEARITQERESAARNLAALNGQLASLQRQSAEAQRLAAEAVENYNLFADQQRAGQRGVPDVVGVFETAIRTKREASDLIYDVARVQVRIAQILGTLVDGEKI